MYVTVAWKPWTAGAKVQERPPSVRGKPSNQGLASRRDVGIAMPRVPRPNLLGPGPWSRIHRRKRGAPCVALDAPGQDSEQPRTARRAHKPRQERIRLTSVLSLVPRSPRSSVVPSPGARCLSPVLPKPEHRSPLSFRTRLFRRSRREGGQWGCLPFRQQPNN